MRLLAAGTVLSSLLVALWLVAGAGLLETTRRSEATSTSAALLRVVDARESAEGSGSDGSGGRRPVPVPDPADAIPDGFGALALMIEEVPGGPPRQGVRVTVRLNGAPTRRLVHGALVKGMESDALLSDRLGRATFTLPADVPLLLEAWDEAFGDGYQELPVAPLGNKELRVLHLPWRRPLERVVEGCVREAWSGAPLRDATVALRDAGTTLARARTGYDGTFRFLAPASTELYVHVEHEGHSPAIAMADAGPYLDLELEEASALEVQVSWPAGGWKLLGSSIVACVEVDARQLVKLGEARDLREDWESVVREVEADQRGRARFGGLPSEVELSVGLSHPADAPDLARVRLTPGQTEPLDLEVPPPGTLSGRLVDPDGTVLGNRSLWIVRDDGPARRFLRDETGTKYALTDPGGSFETTLYAGRYLVGPAPIGGYPAYALAPWGHPVTVESGAWVETTIEADQGLFLEVHLVDQTGQPARSVVAYRREGEPEPRITRWGSEFRLGPLRRGTFEVSLPRFSPQGWDAKRVEVPGPPLELRVPRQEETTGRITGQVIELRSRTGSPQPVVLHGDTELRVLPEPETGAFEFPEVRPGDYTVSVGERGTWMLASVPRPVHLPPGGEVVGLQLTVVPTGTVRVPIRRKQTLYLEAWIDGIFAYRWGPESGDAFEVLVPAGEVELRLTDAETHVLRKWTVLVPEGGTVDTSAQD